MSLNRQKFRSLGQRPEAINKATFNEVSSSVLTISILAMLALSSCTNEEREETLENTATSENQLELDNSLEVLNSLENIYKILIGVCGILIVLSSALSLMSINKKTKNLLQDLSKKIEELNAKKDTPDPSPDSIESYTSDMVEKITEVGDMWGKLFDLHKKRDQELNEAEEKMTNALKIAEGKRESAKQAEELANEFLEKARLETAEADKLLAIAKSDREQTRIRSSEILAKATAEATQLREDARKKALELLSSTTAFAPFSQNLPPVNPNNSITEFSSDDQKQDDTNPGLKVIEDQALLEKLVSLGEKSGTESDEDSSPANPAPSGFERTGGNITPKSGVQLPPKEASSFLFATPNTEDKKSFSGQRQIPRDTHPPLGFAPKVTSPIKRSPPLGLSRPQEPTTQAQISEEQASPFARATEKSASNPSQELFAVDPALVSDDFDLDAIDGLFGGVGEFSSEELFAEDVEVHSPSKIQVADEIVPTPNTDPTPSLSDIEKSLIADRKK
jgi:hypothetical protein